MSALCSARELTARGRGAIRVLELAGPGASQHLERLTPGVRLEPGAFARVHLRDAEGNLLDEAIAWRDGPCRVELHLHGAPAVVARVLDELGAEPEPRGPRTLEERAEERLASAWTETAARILLDQAEGSLRKELERLLKLPEHERQRAARALAHRARSCRWILDPARIVLAGPANAGKSTLFNLLVGRERAVVDPAAGTTRDPLCERVLLGQLGVELFDTAGEREDVSASEEPLEQESRRLALDLRRSADLIVWLVPAGGRAELVPPRASIVLRSQRDRATPGELEGGVRAFSALHAPEDARRQFEEAVLAALSPGELPSPGAGVPFEPEWLRVLERAEAQELGRAVVTWLDGAGIDRASSLA